MAKVRNTSKLAKVLSQILVVVLLLVLVGIVMFLTNNFQETPKAFVVQVNDTIIAQNCDIEFADFSEQQFTMQGFSSDYTVSVVSNKSKSDDFVFYVGENNKPYSFVAFNDFTEDFSLVLSNNSFKLKNNIALLEIIGNKLDVNAKDITITENLKDKIFAFDIVIKSSSDTMTLTFYVSFGEVLGIVLDFEMVVF